LNEFKQVLGLFQLGLVLYLATLFDGPHPPISLADPYSLNSVPVLNPISDPDTVFFMTQPKVRKSKGEKYSIF
jgi:hypothetical protein